MLGRVQLFHRCIVKIWVHIESREKERRKGVVERGVIKRGKIRTALRRKEMAARKFKRERQFRGQRLWTGGYRHTVRGLQPIGWKYIVRSYVHRNRFASQLSRSREIKIWTAWPGLKRSRKYSRDIPLSLEMSATSHWTVDHSRHTWLQHTTKQIPFSNQAMFCWDFIKLLEGYLKYRRTRRNTAICPRTRVSVNYNWQIPTNSIDETRRAFSSHRNGGGGLLRVFIKYY